MRPRDLRAALALQRRLRTVALCSALAVAAIHAPKSHADGARASLGVRCIVPPRVEATVVYQTPTIVVGPFDVERGYVDAPSASKLALRANGGAGYRLRFSPRVAIFRSVQLRASDASGEIGPDGGTLIERRLDRAAEITYRFVLDKHVKPGVYPWPLAVSVRPLDGDQ